MTDAAATEAPAEVAAPEQAETTATAADGKAATEESTTATAAEDTPESDQPEKSTQAATSASTSAPIVSATKRTRPTYKYDPNKITLRFIFANRDGLTVTVECAPTDTVSEVKGALLSVWPEVLPSCSGGDRVRLICMGKGILMPDSRSLKDCEVPVFKTHPTPINVSVRPENVVVSSSKGGSDNKASRGGGGGGGGSSSSTPNGDAVSQGCSCIIL